MKEKSYSSITEKNTGIMLENRIFAQKDASG
jgi:hypothetical protein